MKAMKAMKATRRGFFGLLSGATLGIIRWPWAHVKKPAQIPQPQQWLTTNERFNAKHPRTGGTIPVRQPIRFIARIGADGADRKV